MLASIDCAWTVWLPVAVSWWWAGWFVEWFVMRDCTFAWCFSACWARCALERSAWWCGCEWLAAGELNGAGLAASCWAAVGAGGFAAVGCGAFGDGADLKLTGELDGEELALVQFVEKFEFEFTRSEAPELLFKLWDDEFELLFADWDPLFPPCWRCLEASWAFFREPVSLGGTGRESRLVWAAD